MTYNGALVSWAIDPHGTLADRLPTELDMLLVPHTILGCAELAARDDRLSALFHCRYTLTPRMGESVKITR